MIMPTRLRCEYRENPLGIDCAQPRLSWWLDSDLKDARGVAQSAYQIVVTSDRDGELWNSGKTASDRAFNLAYEGKPLVAAERVNWKVRVWDSRGVESGWSESAAWTMGLLSPQDWKAKWITAPADVKSTRLPLFRKRVP